MIIYDFLKLKNRYKAIYAIIMLVCIAFAFKFFMPKQEKFVETELKTMEQFQEGVKAEKIIRKNGSVTFKSILDLTTVRPTLNGFLNVEVTGKLTQEKHDKYDFMISKLKDAKSAIEAYGCDATFMEGPISTKDNSTFYGLIRLSSTPGKIKKQEMTIEQAQRLINIGQIEVAAVNDKYKTGATTKEKILQSNKYLKKVEVEYKLLMKFDEFFSLRLRVEDGQAEYRIEQVGDIKVDENGTIQIISH